MVAIGIAAVIIISGLLLSGIVFVCYSNFYNEGGEAISSIFIFIFMVAAIILLMVMFIKS